jgi:glycosyltransferase involved in cell wall biosynthesis
LAIETKIAVVGTVGVPAKYGGFETLAENLVVYNDRQSARFKLTVYCSSLAYMNQPNDYRNARLRFIPLKANGVQSIPYDIWSILDAAIRRADVILLLGTSGAFILPLVRAISRTRIICNIDGLEWRRDKWNCLARFVLKALERFAVRYSDVVIADNAAIGAYLAEEYGVDHAIIPYGGDHALDAEPDHTAVAELPDSYALALCRIEPENNVHMILDAWSELDQQLVFVGNWENSAYGRDLKARFKDHAHFHLLDPVYEASALHALRAGAELYVHGHSAGGTNPSLVEMMHFGIPILAHGCSFNRHTTEDRAQYFESREALIQAAQKLTPEAASEIGKAMQEISQRRYTWAHVGKAYFDLIAAA